jgi:hypothetical protein
MADEIAALEHTSTCELVPYPPRGSRFIRLRLTRMVLLCAIRLDWLLVVSSRNMTAIMMRHLLRLLT